MRISLRKRKQIYSFTKHKSTHDIEYIPWYHILQHRTADFDFQTIIYSIKFILYNFS